MFGFWPNISDVADRQGVLVRVARWFRRVWGPMTDAQRVESELVWFSAGGW